MRTKYKSIIYNSAIILFLAIFFFLLSTYLSIKQSENGIRNWKQVEPYSSMDIPDHFTMDYTTILPLDGICMSLGIKGCIWCVILFFITFLALRNLLKLIFRKRIAAIELEILLFASILLLNLALFSYFYEYSLIEQYQCVDASYYRMFKTSLTAMMLASTIASSTGAFVYFIGKIKLNFNKVASPNSDSAAAKSE